MKHETLEFVKAKVHCWIHCVERLAEVATYQPQAALMALVKSLQCAVSGHIAEGNTKLC